MSQSYQVLDMVAQLGNDHSIEEPQQLALAPAHALALAQQQQLLAAQQQQLAANQQQQMQQEQPSASQHTQPLGAIPLAMSLPPGITARSQSMQSFASAQSCMDDPSEDSLIVSPDKSLKLMLAYPASTGRNFAEIIRVLDSL